MARKKTTTVTPTVKPAPKFGAQARKLKRDFLKAQKAQREAMALMIPVKATATKTTAKKKTTTTRRKKSTGVSPTCSRAGRRLKVFASSSAGRTLSSPTCKGKAKKTTAKKRTTTTAKKRTSAVKSIISPVTKAATRKTATRKTTTKKVTAKRTARRSVAASKLARIKKIVC